MKEVKIESLRIAKEHFHSGCKDLSQAYKCAVITVNNIIKETLEEYTNDENHDRVEFWKEVLVELNLFTNAPPMPILSNKNTM